MLGNKAEKKTVSKTLGISYKVQRKRAYFSLGVSLLITLLVLVAKQPDMITTFISRTVSPPVYITLHTQDVDYNKDTIDKIIEFGKYVPNYDADVYISLESDEVSLDEYVQCKISIVDKGIVRMRKPYFYVLFLNSKGEVVSSFPQLRSISYWNKMPPWGTIDYGDFFTDRHHLLKFLAFYFS